MVLDEGTYNGLERDSNIHSRGGVGVDNRVHTIVEPDVVEDQVWHQVQHKI